MKFLYQELDVQYTLSK